MESLFAKEELEDEIVELKIQLLSRFYPFQFNDVQALKKYINFDCFISNEEICWTKELFELVKDEIDWSFIYRIRSLNFRIDTSFLNEYKKYIDFETLHMSVHVDWSIDMFNSFKEKLSHRVIYRSNLFFSNTEIFKFFETEIEWDLLSRSTNLEFSFEFIESYKHLINWKYFSRNPKIPISIDFIQKFSDLIDFDALSQNPASIELIEKYPKSKKWNWEVVVLNPAINFTDENIEFYTENYNRYLFENALSKSFFNSNPAHLVKKLISVQTKDRSYFLQEKYQIFIPWDNFCSQCNTELTLNDVEKFKSKLNFQKDQFILKNKNQITTEFISDNLLLFDSNEIAFYDLAINIEIIEKCNNPSFFKISGNIFLNWSWEYIYDNFQKLNFYKLSRNRAVYDLINLNNFISQQFSILPIFKKGDIISFKQKGNVLYCIHEIKRNENGIESIDCRSKDGQLFEVQDISKLIKHENISSVEFDIDETMDQHRNRIYNKAYQDVESLENEIWKEVKGFPNLYASNMGRILSKSGSLRPRLLKMAPNSNGQLFIMRKKTESSPNWSYQVALIVANTFLSNPYRYKFINHINKDVTDNRIENLAWIKNGKIEQTPYQEKLKEDNSKKEKNHHSDLGWLDE